MKSLYVGSPLSVWSSLWDFVELHKQKKPLGVSKILIPTSHEKRLINREALKRGISGVSPVSFSELVEERLFNNRFFKKEPPAFIDRRVLVGAIKKEKNLGFDDFLEDESRFSLEELRKAVNRICEYLPYGFDFNEKESPIVFLTSIWKKEWIKNDSEYLPSSIKINIAADEKEFKVNKDDSLIACWGISNLNTSQEDFLRPLKEGMNWYVPGPDLLSDIDSSKYLKRLNSYLNKNVIDLGSSKTKIKTVKCGDLINSFYKAKVDGYKNLSCPELILDDVVLMNSLLSNVENEEVLFERPLSSSPSGRVLSFHESRKNKDFIEQNDFIFNLNSLKVFKTLNNLYDFDFDFSNYGLIDFDKDIKRLKKAVLSSILPPKNINLEKLKKWIIFCEKKVDEVVLSRDISKLSSRKSKKIIENLLKETGFSLRDLLFEKDPDLYMRSKSKNITNMKNGVINPNPVAFIGIVDNRFPGKLDLPDWQEDKKNKTALEAIGLPDIQVRIEEESWRAWCLQNRGDSGCSVYWDNIDNRGERQFLTSLLDKKCIKESKCMEIQDSILPVNQFRFQKQIRLSFKESIGDFDSCKDWKVEGLDEKISFSVSDFKKNKPPCLFAYYVSERGKVRSRNKKDSIYPSPLDVGSFIHDCLDILGKEFDEHVDYDELVLDVMHRVSIWHPFNEDVVKKGLFKRWKMFLVEELGRWEEAGFKESHQEYSSSSKFLMSRIPDVEKNYKELKDVEIRGRIDRLEHYVSRSEKINTTIIDYKTGIKDNVDWTQAFFYKYLLKENWNFKDFIYRYLFEESDKDRSWTIHLKDSKREKIREGILKSTVDWKKQWKEGNLVPCWAKGEKPCYWCRNFGREKFWRS